MVIDHGGLHHIHKRKRQAKKLAPYPHPDKRVRFLDSVIYVLAVVIPLMTIPQILLIWVNKSAQNVSIITWWAFLFSSTMWLMYSVVHKEKPLIINSTLWIALELIVIIEIIIFG